MTAVSRGSAEARRRLVLAPYDRGEREAALAAVRQWLADVPGDPDAVELMAGLHCDAGEHAAAMALLEPAIAGHPAHAGLRLMQATAALGGGEVDAAIAAIHKAIALDPDRFRGEGRFSMTMGERLLAPNATGPAPTNAMMALTPVTGTGFDGVVDLVTNATRGVIGEVMKRNPKSERDLMALASGYVGSGNMDMAAEIYDILLKLDPENPMARHMLASALQDDALPRASDGYVASLFDTYAEGFDDSLSELKYQAPRLIAAMLVERHEPEGQEIEAGSLDMLDLGCGTGLCGKLIRPYARRLVGVDLSIGMLRKARDTGLYDKLIQAEITAFLQDCKTPFDVIVSADVLVYFGRLEPIFAGAARVLRPGGRFIFSVEHLADGKGGDLRLNPHGRYSHRESYVRDALSAAGLVPAAIGHAMIRMEHELPVEGLIVSAHKPEATP